MSRLFKAALLGLLIGIMGVAINFFNFAHEIEEDIGLGLLFKLRGIRKPPSDVVVVSIDRESSEQLSLASKSDNPDRWPRSLHARLVENLARAGAAVIIFDVYFIEAHSSKEDNLLARAIKKARNVVLAEPLKAKDVAGPDIGGSKASKHRIVNIVKPIELFSRSAVATAPFVLPRMPVKVNQYWTFQASAGDVPTFPVVAFQLYALRAYNEFIHLLEKANPAQAGTLPGDAGKAISTKGAVRLIRDIREIFESDPSVGHKMLEALELSDLARSDRHTYQVLKSLIEMYGGANRRYLNYYGPPRTLTTIPYSQALKLTDAASDQQIDVKGKVVFIGLSEILLTQTLDSFYTVFSQANGVFISGVEIAATAFSNLLEDAAVKPISSRDYVLIILGWGIFVGVFCRMTSILGAGLGIVFLSILYLIAAEHQFTAAGLWYPVVTPLFVQSPLGFFGAVLWNYVETNTERQRIRKALAYYVPDEVVDQLAKNIVDIRNSGQMVYGACLFTDVAGYTTLSEKMAPQELSELMHHYFEATFDPVKKRGGLIVQLQGDSMLALWKAARPETALRRQACLAALEVAKAVKRFNRDHEKLNLPTRVAIHSGQIYLGNIGAGGHYEYGPTGDTVNTASRMDGLNKYLGTEVLISQDVLDELDGFLTREAGSFRLKGKEQPILVHELLCRKEDSSEKQRRACAIFSDALRAFQRQSWNEASEIFHQSIEYSEDDGLSNFYLGLCEQYQDHPPAGSWDGVISMEEK